MQPVMNKFYLLYMYYSMKNCVMFYMWYIFLVIRQYAEYVGTQMKEPESSVEGKEVRGLPDVVGKL